jgi:hypothetical protein
MAELTTSDIVICSIAPRRLNIAKGDGMPNGPLTPGQIAEYERDGYLLVSGLIPDDVASRAEALMWNALGVTPDDPSKWSPPPQPAGRLEQPEFVGLYTREFLEAAAQLGGGDPVSYQAPRSLYPLNTWPTTDTWRPHGPHIDHAIREHGHKTFPLPVRVATMTYLNDVLPHGGGTVVWPGSHRHIERLARSDPERYATMWALNNDLDKVDIGDVVELTPRRGDVLFYHILTAHSGSLNVTQRPRFAFNVKW